MRRCVARWEIHPVPTPAAICDVAWWACSSPCVSYTIYVDRKVIKMKSRLAVPLVVVALVACSGNESLPKVAGTAPEPATSCASGFWDSPLPEGISIDIAFHPKSDRIYAKEGAVRRRVEVEFLEGDASQAFASAKNSMIAAGYRIEGTEHDYGRGKVSQAFMKDRMPRVWVTIYPSAGKEPFNPEAKGVLAFGWQVSPPKQTKAQ